MASQDYIGPTVLSSYLDNRLPLDSHHGFDLYTPNLILCMQWLDCWPSNSIVYVSFDDISALGPDQMSELVFNLLNGDKHFLWVVRSSKVSKIPYNFVNDLSSKRGLVVSWSPQMTVLSHKAVGYFLTYCRWNSIIVGINLDLLMIGVPQWTDRSMNAESIEDVWKIGVRPRTCEKGLVGRCVRVLMEGERSEEIRRNASRGSWPKSQWGRVEAWTQSLWPSIAHQDFALVKIITYSMLFALVVLYLLSIALVL